MLKNFKTIPLVAIVVLAATFSLFAQGKAPRIATNASLWESVDHSAPPECESTPKECAVSMLKANNIEVGESPLFSVYRLGEIDGKSVTVVLVSHKVNDDDSVAGMLYRVEMSLGDVEDRSFSLDAVGRMYKCARGRTGWSKRLCP